MPEGPEVTIIRENLNEYLEGFYLTDICIFQTSRYIKKAPNNYLQVKNNLPLKLLKIESKGKLIYWVFEKNIYLLNTLGMSGIWTKEPLVHTSIGMDFKFKKSKKSVYFVDPRHFGTLKFLTEKKDLEEKLKTIGPDILNDKTITFETFKKRILKFKHYNITKTLMDQKIISGIGNYLKSEILYRSRISPLRETGDLTEKELKKIFNSAKHLITKSYENNGLSVRDYKDLKNNKGKYQNFIEVYCMEKDSFGNKVQRITTPDKRTTYWVPELQN